MTRRPWLFLLAVCLVGVAGAPWSGPAPVLAGEAACPRLEVLTEELPPYNFTGRGGRLDGVSTALVLEAARRAAREAPAMAAVTAEDIRVIPWPRAYKMAQEPGTCRALFSTARIAEREALFQWAGPLVTMRNMVFKRAGADFELTRPEDLLAHKVGVAANTPSQYYLERLGHQHIVPRFPYQPDLIVQLEKGMVDLFMDNDLSARHRARQAGLDTAGFTAAMEAFTYDLYVAFSPDTPPAVVMAWQRALDAMRADGSRERIVAATAARLGL